MAKEKLTPVSLKATAKVYATNANDYYPTGAEIEVTENIAKTLIAKGYATATQAEAQATATDEPKGKKKKEA